MTAPARVAAYWALTAIEDGRLDVPSALAESRVRLADGRDRALCADIVQGTLRAQRALDHLLSLVARTGQAPADPRVRAILRLSLYQLLSLDRVPASAVVDDAVDLARLAERSHTAGFVNASLRTFLRRRRQLALPPRPVDAEDRERAMAYLGITQSHPDWLVARWLHRHGFDDVESWVRFNNSTPAVTLRANTLVNHRDELSAWLAERGVSTRPSHVAPEGLIVEDAGDQGVIGQPSPRFLIQDEASQLVADLVAVSPGERVLDVCAAPGGKAVVLGGAMRNVGLLVACDVRPRRLRALSATLQRAGVSCARPVHIGRAGALPFGDDFDVVFVDAPCSGLGTVRRDPDIKWRRTARDLPALAETQLDLLVRAASCVRPGGRLIYATCSSEPEENEQVVRAFLEKDARFSVDRALPDRLPALQQFFQPDGWFTTLPFRDALDAFFAAPLVCRTEGVEPTPRDEAGAQ